MLIDWDSLKSKREKAIKNISVNQPTAIAEKLSDRFQNPAFKRLALANENGINLSAGDISAYYKDLSGINDYLSKGQYTAEGHASIAQKAKDNAFALSKQMAEMRKAGYAVDSAAYINANELEKYYAKLNNTLSDKNSVNAMTDSYLNNAAYDLMRLKSDTPTYRETKAEIARLSHVKAAAERRGEDTRAYNRAIDRLSAYANSFDLLNNTTPIGDVMYTKDRLAIYNSKAAELEEYKSIEEKYRDPVEAMIDKGHTYNDDPIIEYYYAVKDEFIPNLEAELEEYKRQFPNDFYRDLKKQSDFAEKSEPIVYKNETSAKNDNLFSAAGIGEANEYYNKVASGEIVTTAKESPIPTFDKYTLWRNQNNFDSKERFDYPQIGEAAKEGNDRHWQYMAKEDEGIYYYLLKTQGEEAAYNYLDELDYRLKKQYENAETEHIQAKAKATNELSRQVFGDWLGGLINSGAALVTKIYGSPTSFADDSLRYLTGGKQDPYNSAHYAANLSDAILQEEAEYIDNATGGWNIGGFSAGDLYQAGVSAAEFTIGGALSPTTYVVLMSMDAARSATKSAYDRGGTPSQIFAESVAAGAFEYLFEKASLDIITGKIVKNLSTVKGNWGKKALANVIAGVLSGATEGSEEIATEAANYIADILIMKDKSERQVLIRDYLKQGYSQAEAEKMANEQFTENMWNAFAGGMFAGWLGGEFLHLTSSAANAYNNVSEKIEDNRLTRNYVKENAPKIAETEGGQESVMQKAQEIVDSGSEEDTKALRKAVEKAEKARGTESYSEKVARVSAEVERSQIRDLSKSDIKAINSIAQEKLTQSGLSGEQTVSAAKVATKLLTEQNLTKAEKKTYQANKEAIDNTVKSLSTDEGAKDIVSRTIKNAQDAANAIQKTREKSGVAQVKNEFADTFTVNDTGENLYNDKPVNVQKFTNISSDNMTAQLDDGTQVKTSDISWGDSNIPAILSTVLDIQKSNKIKMTPTFVNAVYQVYNTASSRTGEGKSVNAKLFANDVREAFITGWSSAKGTDVKFDTEVLTEAEAKILTESARELRDQMSQKSEEEKTSNRTGEKKKGSVTADDSVKTNKDGTINKTGLNDHQKAGIEIMERLAESLGIDFVVFKSQKQGGRWVSRYAENGKNSPNGFYQNGKIYIDLNAGINGDGLILFTISHELVHYMRDGAAKSFDKLADFLVKEYAAQGKTVRDLIHLEMRDHTSLNPDEAYEEVIARLCESFLRDAHLSDKAEQLYKSDKDAANAVLKFLRSVKEKIDKWIKDRIGYGKSISPESPIGKIGEQIAKANNKVLDLFIEGIRRASDNMAYKNTTGEGGVMNMLREDFNGDIFVDVDSSIYDGTDGTSVASVLAKIIKERFNNLISVNGQQIQINKTTNDEWRMSKSARYLQQHNETAYNDKLRAISNADEILKAANNWVGEELKHSRTDDIIEFARGNVQYRVGDNGYIADVIVGTRRSGAAVLYDIKNIYETEITEARVTEASKNSLRTPNASVDNSVTHNEDIVKTQDRFEELLADESIDFENTDPVELLSAYIEAHREAINEMQQRERAAAEKKIKELKQHYKEQRNKEHERRKKTEFRHRVVKMIDDFNKLLNHPVEGKYVPRQFISQTVDFLKMINMDSGRSAKISDKLSTLAIMYESLKNDNDGYASYDVAVEARMKALQEMIVEEAAAWVPKRNKSIKYENARLTREGKAMRPFVTEENFSIQNMSMDLLQYTYDTLNSIRHVIRESINMTGEEQRRTRIQVHKQLIQEINEVRKPHDSLLRLYDDQAKSGYVMFKSFADYKKGSEWENRQTELNKGAIKKAALAQKFSKPFENLLKDYKNLDKMYKTTVDIGLKDASGTPVLITHDMLVCVYLDLQNSQNVDHVVSGGYHIPDIEKYYKGRIKQSFEGGDIANGAGIYAIDIADRMQEAERQMNEAIENGEDTTVYEKQIEALEKEAEQLKGKVEAYFSTIRDNVLKNMTEYDYAWANAWIEFNKMASEEINNTTMELLGFKKAVVDNYFPITVDGKFRAPEFDSIVRDMSLENWNSLKERVKGAKGTILLQGITNVVADRIERTALFCGMAIPIKNFQKVYGVTTFNFNSETNEGEIQTSLQRALDKKFGSSKIGGGANSYIEHLIADMSNATSESTPLDRIMSFIRGGIALKTLTLNPRIWFTQFFSYFGALPEVHTKSLLKGLAAPNAYRYNPLWSKNKRIQVSRVTPLYDLRRAGMSSLEMGDLAKNRTSTAKRAGRVAQKLLNLTQLFDCFTTGQLWYVAESEIRDYTDLKPKTPEFDVAVAKKYNQIIQRTQPNYTPMERAQILRSKNSLTKCFTMWKTQKLQYISMLMDAYGSFNKSIYDKHHNLNNVTARDIAHAGKKAFKTTIAIATSQLMIEVMTATLALLGFTGAFSKKKYKDDDDEVTFLSVLSGIGLNYLSSLAGNFLGGSEIDAIIETAITGKRWSDLEPGMLESVLEIVNNTMKTVNVFQEDGALSSEFLEEVHNRIIDVAGIFGIAGKNAEKFYDGVAGIIEHFADINIFQFSEMDSYLNRAFMARTINELKSGDYDRMNNLAQDKYNEGYNTYWKTGKTEKECIAHGNSEARKFIANTLKSEYLNAWYSKDYKTANAIQSYMYNSGYYTPSEADKALGDWRKAKEKADKEAEVAAERKKK